METNLVGGLEHFLFSHILGILIPIDFHIFQRGGPTTNQKFRDPAFPHGRRPVDPHLSVPRADPAAVPGGLQGPAAPGAVGEHLGEGLPGHRAPVPWRKLGKMGGRTGKCWENVGKSGFCWSFFERFWWFWWENVGKCGELGEVGIFGMIDDFDRRNNVENVGENEQRLEKAGKTW